MSVRIRLDFVRRDNRISLLGANMTPNDQTATTEEEKGDLDLVFLDDAPESSGDIVFERSFPSIMEKKEETLTDLLDVLTDKAGFSDQQDRVRTRMALDEALMNAVIHGNDEDPEREVSVVLRLDADRRSWNVRVEDEGNGFSTEEVTPSEDPEVLVMEGGRGLLVIQESMDQFFYYDGGSGLFMEKSFQAAGSSGKALKEDEEKPELNEQTEGGVTIVRLENARVLNRSTVNEISEELMAVPDGLDRPRIVLDIEEVEYMSSPVLGKLVRFRKRVRNAGGGLRICNVHPDIRDVFEMTDLHHVFDLHDDREGAIAAMEKEV